MEPNLLPPYYREASAGRRLLAAAINFHCVGVPLVIWRFAGFIETENLLARMAPAVWVMVFWLWSGWAKSPGVMVSMIEIRSAASVPLSCRQKLRRSFPYFCFGWLICFPASVLPSPAVEVKALLLLVGCIAMLADGAFVYLGGPSLCDRACGTTVMQLSLPSNMMPRVLGMRIW